jgi:hypothetical protein
LQYTPLFAIACKKKSKAESKKVAVHPRALTTYGGRKKGNSNNNLNNGKKGEELNHPYWQKEDLSS